MESYTTTIEFEAPITQVFRAISKELGNWWGKQDSLIEQNDTVFKVEWGEPWYLFKVVEFRKDDLMIWECIDANQIIDGLSGVKKEWVGTSIHWALEELPNARTLLKFEHEGLVPAFVCFDFCSASWDHFLKERLVKYLHDSPIL